MLDAYGSIVHFHHSAYSSCTQFFILPDAHCSFVSCRIFHSGSRIHIIRSSASLWHHCPLALLESMRFQYHIYIMNACLTNVHIKYIITLVLSYSSSFSPHHHHHHHHHPYHHHTLTNIFQPLHIHTSSLLSFTRLLD